LNFTPERLKSRKIQPEGRKKQKESENDKEKDKLPHPSEPFLIRYPRYRENSHKDSRTRSDHIGETVAELESKDGSLAGTPDHI
jgi:hypothetical protein